MIFSRKTWRIGGNAARYLSGLASVLFWVSPRGEVRAAYVPTIDCAKTLTPTLSGVCQPLTPRIEWLEE
jgi:hypothetical protein